MIAEVNTASKNMGFLDLPRLYYSHFWKDFALAAL